LADIDMLSANAQPHFQRLPAWFRFMLAAWALCLAGGCAQSPGPAVWDAVTRTSPRAIDAPVGRWAYAQSCGWEHSAQLEVSAVSDGIRGIWSDGTRVRGDSGELRGTLRDGKWFLRFCSDADTEGQQTCPDFGAESSYVVPKDGRLKWYRKHGTDGYREYLSLHRVDGDRTPLSMSIVRKKIPGLE
jgi:hypothetical protein